MKAGLRIGKVMEDPNGTNKIKRFELEGEMVDIGLDQANVALRGNIGGRHPDSSPKVDGYNFARELG
jgi:hypothetical protein